MGEGTPTRLADGWIIMIILTVPFVFMVVVFSLCCCRYHYFDYFRPISKWRAQRKAQRMEEVGNNGFVVGDVRRQHSVVGIYEEEGETLSQRIRRLREGSEGEFEGHYSPTVHLSPGYRSARTPSAGGSIVGHYPSMVPEVPFSTMASVNGMAGGSSYCPSVASTSYRPVSQLGSMYSHDTRDPFHPASQPGSSNGTMTGSQISPFANPGNFQTFARYPSYNSTPSPSVASFHRISYPSRDSLRSISQSSSRNGGAASQSPFSPSTRQVPSRRTSLLSMQELPPSGRKNLQTVQERSASMDEQAEESASIDNRVETQVEVRDGMAVESSETCDNNLSTS